MNIAPREFLELTPREVGRIAAIRRKQEIEERRKQRFETAIICSFIARAFGGNKTASAWRIYQGMKISDPDEEIRRYAGGAADQIEAHKKWLGTAEAKRFRNASNY